jgi:hypothetical protein
MINLDSLRIPRIFQVARSKSEVLSIDGKPRNTPSRGLKQNILHRMTGRD